MKFSKALSRFSKKAKENKERAVAGTKIALFSAVITDSPVLDGRLRGNWQTTVETSASNAIDRLDKTGSKAIQEVINEIGQAEDITFLTNNLPYAYDIEYLGRSKKAPEGMVRRNVARFEKILQQEARKAKK
jgi:hypothetical protein